MAASLAYKMFQSKSQHPLHMAIRMKREDVVFLYLVDNDAQVKWLESLVSPNSLVTNVWGECSAFYSSSDNSCSLCGMTPCSLWTLWTGKLSKSFRSGHLLGSTMFLHRVEYVVNVTAPNPPFSHYIVLNFPRFKILTFINFLEFCLVLHANNGVWRRSK